MKDLFFKEYHATFLYIAVFCKEIFKRLLRKICCKDPLCVIQFFIASRIRYEITRGNFGGAFAVKNMTGAIYVAGQLDYETRKRVSQSFRYIWQI